MISVIKLLAPRKQLICRVSTLPQARQIVKNFNRHRTPQQRKAGVKYQIKPE